MPGWLASACVLPVSKQCMLPAGSCCAAASLCAPETMLFVCRSVAYSNAMSGGAEPAFSPAGSHRASAVGGHTGPAAAARPSYDGGSGHVSAEPSAAAQRGAAGLAEGDDFISPPRAARRPAAPTASPAAADWNAYDERPAQAKGAYNFQNADESSTPVNARRTSATGPAARPPPANDVGPPPPGFPTGGHPFLTFAL